MRLDTPSGNKRRVREEDEVSDKEDSLDYPLDGPLFSGMFVGSEAMEDASGSLEISVMQGEFWITLKSPQFFCMQEVDYPDTFLFFSKLKEPKGGNVDLKRSVMVPIPTADGTGALPDPPPTKELSGSLGVSLTTRRFSLRDVLDHRKDGRPEPVDPRKFKTLVVAKVLPKKSTACFAYARLVPSGTSDFEIASARAETLRRASLSLAPTLGPGFRSGELAPIELSILNYAQLNDLAESCFGQLGKPKNGGSLSFSEFITVLAQLGISFTEARAFVWFDCADEDGSGTMEFEEFRQLIAMVSRVSTPSFLTLFDVYTLFSVDNAAEAKSRRASEEAWAQGVVGATAPIPRPPVREELPRVDILAMKAIFEQFRYESGIKLSDEKLEAMFRLKDSRTNLGSLGYEQVKSIWLELISPQAELSKRGVSIDSLLSGRLIKSADPASLRAHLNVVVEREERELRANLLAGMNEASRMLEEWQIEQEAIREAELAKRTLNKKENRKKVYLDRQLAIAREKEDASKRERDALEGVLKNTLDSIKGESEAALTRAEDEEAKASEVIEAHRRARLGTDALDLASRGLQFLPPLMWSTPEGMNRLKHLVILDVSGNSLIALPGKSLFSACASLQKLDISWNNLRGLPNELGCLTQLRILKADGNVLDKLPATLGELRALQRLNLASNRLCELPGNGVMRRLVSLQDLNLGNNCLRELPPDFFSMSSLVDLNLQSNQLVYLPEFHRCRRLRRLNLSSNLITEVPESLGNAQRLSHLNLSNNRMRHTFRSLGNCCSLVSLDLARNTLKDLPESLGNLTRLSLLDASENEIAGLSSPHFASLLSLQRLDLSSNKIEILPNTIGNCSQIQALNLSKNCLRSLPNDIAGLSSLRHLDVHSNALGVSALTMFPPSISSLVSLLWLDASYNLASGVCPQLALLPSLRHLNLSNNRLTEVTEELLSPPALETLDLSNNSIVRVSPKIGGCSNLRAIDLSVNRLAFIPPSIADAPALRHLHLFNNALTSLPYTLAWLLPQLLSFDVAKNPLRGLPPKWVAEEVLGAESILSLRFSRERQESLKVQLRRARARVIARHISLQEADEEDIRDKNRLGMLLEDTRARRSGPGALIVDLSEFGSSAGKNWGRTKPGCVRDTQKEWADFISQEIAIDEAEARARDAALAEKIEREKNEAFLASVAAAEDTAAIRVGGLSEAEQLDDEDTIKDKGGEVFEVAGIKDDGLGFYVDVKSSGGNSGSKTAPFLKSPSQSLGLIPGESSPGISQEKDFLRSLGVAIEERTGGSSGETLITPFPPLPPYVCDEEAEKARIAEETARASQTKTLEEELDATLGIKKHAVIINIKPAGPLYRPSRMELERRTVIQNRPRVAPLASRPSSSPDGGSRPGTAVLGKLRSDLEASMNSSDNAGLMNANVVGSPSLGQDISLLSMKAYIGVVKAAGFVPDPWEDSPVLFGTDEQRILEAKKVGEKTHPLEAAPSETTADVVEVHQSKPTSHDVQYSLEFSSSGASGSSVDSDGGDRASPTRRMRSKVRHRHMYEQHERAKEASSILTSRLISERSERRAKKRSLRNNLTVSSFPLPVDSELEPSPLPEIGLSQSQSAVSTSDFDSSTYQNNDSITPSVKMQRGTSGGDVVIVKEASCVAPAVVSRNSYSHGELGSSEPMAERSVPLVSESSMRAAVSTFGGALALEALGDRELAIEEEDKEWTRRVHSRASRRAKNSGKGPSVGIPRSILAHALGASFAGPEELTELAGSQEAIYPDTSSLNPQTTSSIEDFTPNRTPKNELGATASAKTPLNNSSVSEKLGIDAVDATPDSLHTKLFLSEVSKKMSETVELELYPKTGASAHYTPLPSTIGGHFQHSEVIRNFQRLRGMIRGGSHELESFYGPHHDLFPRNDISESSFGGGSRLRALATGQDISQQSKGFGGVASGVIKHLHPSHGILHNALDGLGMVRAAALVQSSDRDFFNGVEISGRRGRLLQRRAVAQKLDLVAQRSGIRVSSESPRVVLRHKSKGRGRRHVLSAEYGARAQDERKRQLRHLALDGSWIEEDGVAAAASNLSRSLAQDAKIGTEFTSVGTISIENAKRLRAMASQSAGELSDDGGLGHLKKAASEARAAIQAKKLKAMLWELGMDENGQTLTQEAKDSVLSEEERNLSLALRKKKAQDSLADQLRSSTGFREDGLPEGFHLTSVSTFDYSMSKEVVDAYDDLLAGGVLYLADKQKNAALKKKRARLAKALGMGDGGEISRQHTPSLTQIRHSVRSSTLNSALASRTSTATGVRTGVNSLPFSPTATSIMDDVYRKAQQAVEIKRVEREAVADHILQTKRIWQANSLGLPPPPPVGGGAGRQHSPPEVIVPINKEGNYSPTRDPAHLIRSDAFEQEFGTLGAPVSGIVKLRPKFGEGLFTGLFSGDPYAPPPSEKGEVLFDPDTPIASKNRKVNEAAPPKVKLKIPDPSELTGLVLSRTDRTKEPLSSESVYEKRQLHESRLLHAQDQVKKFRYLGGVTFIDNDVQDGFQEEQIQNSVHKQIVKADLEGDLAFKGKLAELDKANGNAPLPLHDPIAKRSQHPLQKLTAFASTLADVPNATSISKPSASRVSLGTNDGVGDGADIDREEKRLQAELDALQAEVRGYDRVDPPRDDEPADEDGPNDGGGEIVSRDILSFEDMAFLSAPIGDLPAQNSETALVFDEEADSEVPLGQAVLRRTNPFQATSQTSIASVNRSYAEELQIKLSASDRNNNADTRRHKPAAFQNGYTSGDIADFLRIQATYIPAAEAEWRERGGGYLERRLVSRDFVRAVRRRIQGRDPLTGIPEEDLYGVVPSAPGAPTRGSPGYRDPWDPLLIPNIRRYLAICLRDGVPPVFNDPTPEQLEVRSRFQKLAAAEKTRKGDMVLQAIKEQWKEYCKLYTVTIEEHTRRVRLDQARRAAKKAKIALLIKQLMQLAIDKKKAKLHANTQKLIAKKSAETAQLLEVVKRKQEEQNEKLRQEAEELGVSVETLTSREFSILGLRRVKKKS